MPDPAATPALRPLHFYFDFISPYAYLAWSKIHPFAAKNHCEVIPVPVLFAAMLNVNGQKGPAEIPSKRSYTFKNILRLARDHGLPIAMPPSHPFNPLLALRVACLPLAPVVRRAVIDTLYREVWTSGRGVEDPQVIRDVLAGFGLDVEALMTQAASDETKMVLRANTDDAIRRGVFGVPSIRIDDEVFWGLDSLPHVEAFLAGHDPVTPEWLAQLAALPASAAR